MRPPSKAPGQENRERSTTYTVPYVCDNCGNHQTIEFKKGENAPVHAESPCDNCGCSYLFKVKEKGVRWA